MLYTYTNQSMDPKTQKTQLIWMNRAQCWNKMYGYLYVHGSNALLMLHVMDNRLHLNSGFLFSNQRILQYCAFTWQI